MRTFGTREERKREERPWNHPFQCDSVVARSILQVYPLLSVSAPVSTDREDSATCDVTALLSLSTYSSSFTGLITPGTETRADNTFLICPLLTVHSTASVTDLNTLGRPLKKLCT
eukprot:TRINITY_DN18699_c0_g1_i1.p1 TRINITY_DN18699_c0_g1~~TRINITY_DN18699_c0_g1_i1.p1  ORF type:complete len:115 (+),score=25.32 TRINITY_DN18699_c0_g1_i1:252-596(+)